jgi:aryl-alcohol dehydrogenase-like predicted oxidoreductase
MLHGIDPNVPVEISAGAMEDLVRQGIALRVGVCNVDVAELQQFSGATTCSAIQCPLNLLQPESLESLIPAAVALGCDVHVYWTLMKGLLAGKIDRDHVFAEGDSRPKYDVFKGEARERAHHVVDNLKRISDETGKTVAQLAISWAVSQPGVSAALVGARRPEQAREIVSYQR